MTVGRAGKSKKKLGNLTGEIFLAERAAAHLNYKSVEHFLFYGKIRSPPTRGLADGSYSAESRLLGTRVMSLALKSQM